MQRDGDFVLSTLLYTESCLQTVDYNYLISQQQQPGAYNVKLYCDDQCVTCKSDFNTNEGECVSDPSFAGDSFQLTSAQCLGGSPTAGPPVPNALSLELTAGIKCDTDSVAVYSMGNTTSCQKWDSTFAQVTPGTKSGTWTVLLDCEDEECSICGLKAANIGLGACHYVQGISVRLVQSDSLGPCTSTAV